jgi:hypothetical protein
MAVMGEIMLDQRGHLNRKLTLPTRDFSEHSYVFRADSP